MKRVLVTGSSGLIGSEAVAYFDERGAQVHGVDNNMRMDFFGPGGDTRWNRDRLRSVCQRFTHHELDIRDRQLVGKLFEQVNPELVIHCAAQPSHDLARERPLDDFDVNAVGTVNLLEATRRHAPEAVFCFMSTNKVYGDTPNRLPLAEREKRWDYARPEDFHGIPETCSIDQSQHSVFGASKVAADVMAQEYARCWGLKTGVFRGGCLTGPSHSGVELHGFLNYFVKVAKSGGKYRIFGYKGKQVRDQIHSFDVIRALHEFALNPRPGEVYNLGGGRDNSCSILECIDTVKALTGRSLDHEYVDENRRGDHICYISDLRKLKSHFPNWSITKSLPEIWQEMIRG
jgi:CDP-paratose 2-epimerase